MALRAVGNHPEKFRPRNTREVTMRVRFPETIQSVILTLGTLALIVGTMTPADAQELKALQTQKDPLVLKAQGSFYVGGEAVKQTRGELGNFGPAGQISVNQMYVRYMIP